MFDSEQPYEQPQQDVRYTYFDRFKYILPPFLYQELIGISPQKRRAFLLQQRYLVPLTFSYSILQFFTRFSVIVSVEHFIKFFWEVKGDDDPIMFGLLLVIFLLCFGLFRLTQAKNTITIKEEVIYKTVVDGSAFICATIEVFNINHLWLGFFR